jgi:hypothetical protein
VNTYTDARGKAVRVIKDTRPLQPQHVGNMVRAIVRGYNNPETRNGGFYWYEQWEQIVIVLSDHFGVSRDVARGVLCACSMGVSPEVTIGFAVQSLRTRQGVTAFGARIPQLILDGADPLTCLGTEKIYAFFHDTKNRGKDDTHVTVDRWCARTASGDYSIETVQQTGESYHYWVRVVRMATRIANWLLGVTLTAAEAQALAWEIERAERGDVRDDMWAALVKNSVPVPSITLTVH